MCSQPFPLVCLAPLRPSPPPVLGLGALPNHPRSLPSSKSYTRAGLQGIVNCSCSANLHKSILNQLSGLRRVRAGRLAGWKCTGYAQVPDETRRDETRRNAMRRDAERRHVPFVPYDDLYTGCLEPRRRYACAIVPTHCDLRVSVCTRSNRVTPDGVSNRRDAAARAKKFRGVTTAYRVTEGRGARRRKKGRGISMAHKNEMFR